MNISTVVYDFSNCNLASPEQLKSLDYIYQCLSFLETEYPSFKVWFYFKVLPGIARGERTIILNKNLSEIAGISILKKSINENKICTLWVNKKYQAKGIGQNLLENSIEILKDGKPLISVSESRMGEFRPLLEKFNFSLKNSYLSIYKKDAFEYSFNGYLFQEKAHPKNMFWRVSTLFNMTTA